MKHYLLTLLTFCIATSFLQAQDRPYLPTAVEGANWIMKDSETPHYPYFAFVRRIEGDTMVDGRAYKKLYQQVIDHIEDEFTDPQLARPYKVFPERELIGLLRDDVAERQVYGMVRNTFSGAPDFSNDTLLHDYSLTVGDTLRGLGFGPDFGGAPIIHEVAYEVRFGEIRRIQQADWESYIEGIGSAYGPVSGGSSLLVGCCINIVVEYCKGDLADCNVWLTSTTNLSQDLTIKTQPNPFSTSLSFLPEGKQTGEPIIVRLQDVTGRMVREGTLGNGLQWQTEALPAGLYLATFTSGGRSATTKLIKQ